MTVDEVVGAAVMLVGGFVKRVIPKNLCFGTYFLNSLYLPSKENIPLHTVHLSMSIIPIATANFRISD